jgi:tetratricopeptide (TPR) repeat protein
MKAMKCVILFALCLFLAVFVWAQQKSEPQASSPGASSANQTPSANPAPSANPNAPVDANNPTPSGPASPGQGSASQPNSDDENDADESSSHETRTDITPPQDDAKSHPESKSAVEDLVPPPPSPSSVQEFHPWNPMKASKDVEVGNFYFKRGNYKAALDRYKEALYYKENDAVATYRLAVCQEKVGDKDEARKNFEQYLKILPEGPYAKDARASLEKLGKKQPANN